MGPKTDRTTLVYIELHHHKKNKDQEINLASWYRKCTAITRLKASELNQDTLPIKIVMTRYAFGGEIKQFQMLKVNVDFIDMWFCHRYILNIF